MTELLRIDASGSAGDPGRDGSTPARTAAPRGGRGRSGGDASSPTAGQDAGFIEIDCRRGKAVGKWMEVTGSSRVASGQKQTVHETVSYDRAGSVLLVAQGGPGGDGGRGGDGQDGGRGDDGSSATRWSRGGDGQTGGDGGHGGDGTSGAPGGRGGRVLVRIDDSDTCLLMLIEEDIRGGLGGRPGANGRGGAGGPGGDGGSAHHWTTHSTEHYTDAQGNNQTRTVAHHHHQPGGSQGASGRPGRNGQAVLDAGRDADDGQFLICVHYPDHDVEYVRRYELEIVDYHLILTDAFAEPTSEVIVSHVEVRNVGGMPSPAGDRPEVRLAEGPWVVPLGNSLVIPRSLEPGESYRFETERLVAHVPDLDHIVTGSPLSERTLIDPVAIQPVVERPYANTHDRSEFTVAFPVEIASVESLESQTPGQAAVMRFRAVNGSRSDLGSGSGTGRRLQWHVALADPSLAPYLMMLDKAGNVVPWEPGFQATLDSLEAGAESEMEILLGVLPGAPGYTRVDIHVTLQLGEIGGPDNVRDRHRRIHSLRIAAAYAYDPDADILLVANHSTTRDEKLEWEKTAVSLGRKLAVWDISLNDELSLSDRLAHGQNLLRDFHGRTIVLSNAPFDTALGSRYGDQFLSQMDLIKAAESHQIRFLVVNADTHDVSYLFQERLIPTDGQPEYRYDSVREFEKQRPQDDVDQLFEQVQELIQHGAQAAQADPIRQTSQIDVYGWRSPSAKRLRRQAIRLQRKLQNAVPGRRVVVRYSLPSDLDAAEVPIAEEQAKHGGLFFTHEFQGRLTVMPTMGDAHPNIVVLNAGEEEIHDAEFVAGRAVRVALLQSLGFQEKVYLLADRMRELGECARITPDKSTGNETWVDEALVDAILVDVATERSAALKTGWRSSLANRAIGSSLKQLRFLAEHAWVLIQGTPGQPDVDLSVRLLAGIEWLGNTSARWYESRLFPWGFFRRGPAVRGVFLEHHAGLAKNLLGQITDDVRAATDLRVDELKAACRLVRRQGKLTRLPAAGPTLCATSSQYAIQRDSGQPFPSVLAHDQWQSICQAEGRRESARQTLGEKKQRARNTFSVASQGRPLPHVAAQVRQSLERFSAACKDPRPPI